MRKCFLSAIIISLLQYANAASGQQLKFIHLLDVNANGINAGAIAYQLSIIDEAPRLCVSMFRCIKDEQRPA